MPEGSLEQLSQQLQDALLNVTLCLKNLSLTADARQTLVRTMEVLSTEWSRLRTEGRLTRPEEDYSVLHTMVELCGVMANVPEAEVAVFEQRAGQNSRGMGSATSGRDSAFRSCGGEKRARNKTRTCTGDAVESSPPITASPTCTETGGYGAT